MVEQIKLEVTRRASEGGNLIRNEVIKSFEGPRHGKWYGNHRASAPGEAPAIATGGLHNSWNSKTEVTKNGNTTLIDSSAESNTARSGLSPGFNYAWINDGTRYIKPRPYVESSLSKARDELIKKLSRKYNV